MKRRLKTRKIPKVYSPIELYERIKVYKNIQEGNVVSPTAPEPLSPFGLTRIQQNLLIDFLKYSEAFTNTELADYLKIDKKTVARRLIEINEVQALELQEKGFNVWGVIHRLKMTVEYVKKQARVKDDPDLFLRAELAFINQCQKLGIVFEKPQELSINYPMHSEQDELRIIAWLRKQELEALNPPTVKEVKESEVVEIISEIPNI